ncbi:TVP38/TMEM64 family protein, partial [Vibrio chemaguriensis]|nr:TVP38/TMEM64 family protein [Vibrio chemaguriensis]
AVYLNAGTQLATIDSLSGIVSPTVLASFALLGLFPILVKWVMNKVRPTPPQPNGSI